MHEARTFSDPLTDSDRRVICQIAIYASSQSRRIICLDDVLNLENESAVETGLAHIKSLEDLSSASDHRAVHVVTPQLAAQVATELQIRHQRN